MAKAVSLKIVAGPLRDMKLHGRAVQLPNEAYRQGFLPLQYSVELHRPSPTDEGARVLFAQYIVRKLRCELGDASAKADLNNPQEFHGLLWEITRHLRSVERIALEQKKDKATVNRWINGIMTPPAFRRRGILQSALQVWDDEFEADPPPAFKEYTRKGAAPKGRARLKMISIED